MHSVPRWLAPHLLGFAVVTTSACDPHDGSADDSTLRGCDDDCAPVPPLPTNDCTDRGIVDIADMLGDEDVSADLEAAIEWATQNGWAAGLSPGVYHLARPLRLPSDAHLVGSGPDTVLLASTKPGAWAHDEAMVEIVGVEGTRICDLTLDAYGAKRMHESQRLSFTMLISNTAYAFVKSVEFRNHGMSADADAPGIDPALLIISRQAGDAPYHEEGDVGELGPTRATVLQSEFTIAPEIRSAYAIRVYTDSATRRPPEKFEWRAIPWIQSNVFRGDFYWNTVELTGGGTGGWGGMTANSFHGRALNHIDIDDGASQVQLVGGGEFFHAGAPDWLDATMAPREDAGMPMPPTAAIANHGTDKEYRNYDNHITHSRIWNLESAEPWAEHEDAGAIVVWNTGGSTNLADNVVENVFDGTHGAALVVGSHVARVSLGRSSVGYFGGPVRVGVRTSATAEDVGDVGISETSIVALEAAIDVANAEYVELYGNEISVPASSPSPAVTLDGDAALVERNVIEGGRHALVSSAWDAIVRQNLAGGCEDYTYRIEIDATLRDNAAWGEGLAGSPHRHCAISPEASVGESDNDFVCGSE